MTDCVEHCFRGWWTWL